MGRKVRQTLIWLLACCFASCTKDKPAAVPTTLKNSNIYIVCEGMFGVGDASLYTFRNDSAWGDLYKGVNNESLGDVFQSMTRIGNNFFLCVNNSDKIAIINAGNLRLLGNIKIPKPRYILPITDTKAYVSSLYHNKVYIINPAAMQVTDSIALPFKNTEGMLQLDGYAYICTWDTVSNKIYKVNILNDSIEKSIPVAGYAPQEVLVDREQMLWVLSGDQPGGRTATLTRIDPSTGEILKSYTFPGAANPMKPVLNSTKDTLYFIEADYNGGTANNGVYRMSIHDAALPAQPFKAASHNQYFYALGIDPATGYIFIGDPKGFIQKGSVYVYRPDGSQLASVDVGVGPGHFYFDRY